MGQMTYAVIFGVRMEAPEHLGDERWWTLSERYERRSGAKGPVPDHPHGDGADSFDGFWCAVGASGRDGVPDLAGFPLDDPGSASKEHAKAIETAKKAWADFAAWCAEPRKGGRAPYAWTQPAIVFPVPRLYLVETEVA